MTRRPPRLLRLLPCLLSLGAAAQPSPAGTPAPAPAKVKPYTGHGAGSVAPEVLARYAPPPLAPRCRTASSPCSTCAPRAPAWPLPDGKRLFFTWKVTGTSQVWRLDGPQRFPVQMTGGEDTTWLATVTPDGELLLVQRDAKGEENPGLYVQTAGGGPLALIQHMPNVQTLHRIRLRRFALRVFPRQRPQARLLRHLPLGAQHRK